MLTEAQQAFFDFLNVPGVYPDGVDAIGEVDVDEDDNLVGTFQDGKKIVEMKVLGDPPDLYESKILNPEALD
jgi:hypothetical protein